MVLRLDGDMILKVSVMSGSLKLRLCRRRKLRSVKETENVKFDVYDEKLPDSHPQLASHRNYLERTTLMSTVRHLLEEVKEANEKDGSVVLVLWAALGLLQVVVHLTQAPEQDMAAAVEHCWIGTLIDQSLVTVKTNLS
jgi:hypothetical protein